MKNENSRRNTLVLLLLLVIAMAIVWFINEQPGNYDQIEVNTTTETAATDETSDNGQIEINTITETLESDEISDIEFDMEFDVDSALDLEGFE